MPGKSYSPNTTHRQPCTQKIDFVETSGSKPLIPTIKKRTLAGSKPRWSGNPTMMRTRCPFARNSSAWVSFSCASKHRLQGISTCCIPHLCTQSMHTHTAQPAEGKDFRSASGCCNGE